MTEFFNFCREYAVYILGGLCFVFQVVCLLVKRRPKTVDEFLYALNEVRLLVPGYVKAVECPGNGDTKKKAVIKIIEDLLARKLKRNITDKECAILDSLVDADIEAVLAAPTKKEIL